MLHSNAVDVNVANGVYTIAATSISPSICSMLDREKLPERAKSLMYRPEFSNMLRLKIADEDGYVARDEMIMPDIENVDVIYRTFKSQVIVTFADNTKEIATLDRHDFFSLEQGISVCITKKLLSDKVGNGYGSSVYNKLIDRAVKIFHKNEWMKSKKEAEETEKKRKYEKTIAKKKAKREKRLAAERENLIEIHKEAYLRAMNAFNNRSAN